MAELSTTIAKLSGIRKALLAAMDENVSRNRGAGEVRTRATFTPDQVQHYFKQASDQLNNLKTLLPHLYSDFQVIQINPEKEMAATDAEQKPVMHFGRSQLERLVRGIDQIFEIRANSELEQPKQENKNCVFISHGHAKDWRAVQPYIEKDIGLSTIELEQEPSMGRTIFEKLEANAARCDSAVIVMTGDDMTKQDEARVRENVMHEIGYFQGAYGRTFVILLHEEGVNIPTNLSGVVYVPYPKEHIEASFHVLQRELKAIYNI